MLVFAHFLDLKKYNLLITIESGEKGRELLSFPYDFENNY
jgi:hypothetical protein